MLSLGGADGQENVVIFLFKIRSLGLGIVKNLTIQFVSLQTSQSFIDCVFFVFVFRRSEFPEFLADSSYCCRTV